jgi:putative membrane protein
MKARIIIFLLFSASVCLLNCARQMREPDRTAATAVEAKQSVEPDLYFGASLSEAEEDFIANAVASNYADIKFARLAISRSENKKVKEIAKTLADDHSKVLNGLICFAHKRGIVIPAEENFEAKRTISSLEKDDQFDRHWCSELLDKHETALKQFEYMWEQTEDLELREWINNTLPELIAHLEKLMEYEGSYSSRTPNVKMTSQERSSF